MVMYLSFETLLTSIHKNWLTYSAGTNRPGGLCYNFAVSIDLTQMLTFPYGSYSPAILDLFNPFDPTICSRIFIFRS